MSDQKQLVVKSLTIIIIFFVIIFSLLDISSFFKVSANEEIGFPAVVKEDANCIFGSNGEYTITISKYVVLDLIMIDDSAQWGLVKLNEVIVCWIKLSFLSYEEDVNSLPRENLPLFLLWTPTVAPQGTSVSSIPTYDIGVTPTLPSRLIIRWRVLSYDCFNGEATGVTIGLDVSGGVKEYSYSPNLPIYAKPGQILSIKVGSNTSNGEPNGTISFKVPESLDISYFNCKKSGNVPGPNSLPPTDLPPTDLPPTDLPPTDPPPTDLPPTDPPPTDPPPTEEPVCYNPQGKVIPCTGPRSP